MSEQFSDQYWMEKALNYANEAAAINEIPVGAVLVKDNQLISYGYNQHSTNRNFINRSRLIGVV